MDSRELDRMVGTYGPGFKFHDENLWMLSWYAERLVRALRGRGIHSLLSLGIGHQVVSRAILDGLAGDLRRYTIVEGSRASIEAFRSRQPLPETTEVVQAFFEEFTPSQPLDAIEMGFVLEHVDDPALVVKRFAGFLRPGGCMIIVVPNARALHRRFGHAAGLLEDVYQLSEHDLALGHKRYFDLASLKALVQGAGLRILSTEGVFLKCLTTSQLEQLALPAAVTRSFFEVGVDFPDIANAIYLETSR